MNRRVVTTGRERLLAVGAVVLVVAVVLVTDRLTIRTPPSSPLATAAARSGSNTADPPDEGVDLFQVSIPTWVFGRAIPSPTSQRGSEALADVAPVSPRLRVSALPSGAATAAVYVLEESPRGHRWGELMIPAERTMFRAFAADPSLGEWLVVVDDVHVLWGVDPIPTTAYRWNRNDVEAYAQCGIPPKAIDRCTHEFYAKPQMVLIGGVGSRSQNF